MNQNRVYQLVWVLVRLLPSVVRTRKFKRILGPTKDTFIADPEFAHICRQIRRIDLSTHFVSGEQ